MERITEAPTDGRDDASLERGPEAVRQRLIEATRDLIAERSPAMITNKEIAAAAGVNHGQIHHYFESKDNLVAAAILAHADSFVRQYFGRDAEMPVPLNTRRRSPIWRGLAYLAVQQGDAAGSCTQGAYFLTTWRLHQADESWRQLRGRLQLYGLTP